jgi:hypothetical protein
MTDAYPNRIATLCAASIWCYRAGFLRRSRLVSCLNDILNGGGTENFLHWAVHPGGGTVLDAMEEDAGLPNELLAQSRAILRRLGNMSSTTVMWCSGE